MRSESKEVYGTNVLGLVAMLHQLRRWWAIRELRQHWKLDRYFLVTCRKFNHLNCHIDSFNFHRRYEFIRMFTEYHLQRGAI